MKFPRSSDAVLIKRVAALLCVSALFLSARLPTISTQERQRLASEFHFARKPLPEVGGAEVRRVRPVNPNLQHIAAWISSVGAGAAVTDIDGDGLANDVCYVNVATDQVIVAPIPGTGDRFRPFALDAGQLFDRTTMAPTGCLPGDMNEDGRMDLLVYYWGRAPLAFLQGANKHFQASEIVPDQRWFTNAATFADIDGDGHPDLIVGNYFPDGAHILDSSSNVPDTMQHSMSRALNGGDKHVLLWSGLQGGRAVYREAANVFAPDVRRGWTLAIGAQDLDNDLLPELYFVNDFGHDRLLHNLSTPGCPRFELVEGERGFATPSSKVLGRDSFKGMGIDFGDINQDGLTDVFISNISAPYALEESNLLFINNGRSGEMHRRLAPFVEKSESYGLARAGSWSWDCKLADFTNGGALQVLQAVGFLRGTVNRWPELHEVAMGNDNLLANPSHWHKFQPGDDLSGHDHNPFFVRAHDGRYYDLAEEIGIGQSEISRGIAVADVDGDGKLDYVIANQWEPSAFFHNESRSEGDFLGLRLRIHNRPAIGAKASFRLPNGRFMTSQVDGGSGHSGKRSPELHFGLGQLLPGTLLDVTISWRDEQGIHSRTVKLAPGWHMEDLTNG